MSNAVKWIKITTNIFDDEKIKYIEKTPNGDETIVIWLRLLCLAGKSNSNGMLMLTDKIPYTEEMLSTIFGRDIMAIQLALSLFNQLEMVEIVDNRIMISNWEKHQNIDGLERIRENNRERQIRHRERQKLVITEFSETKKRFTPPTLEEVEAYVKEMNYSFDPKAFHAFYTSKNWMVGKNKMADWHAACRTWQTSRYGSAQPKYTPLDGIPRQYTRKVEPMPDYGPPSEPMTEEEIEAIKAAFKRIGQQGLNQKGNTNAEDD